MMFLTMDDVEYLGPWVWRSWKRNLYSGGTWWKLEDLIDISDLQRGACDRINIKDELNQTECVPFARFLLVPKTSHRGASRSQLTSKVKKNVTCVALACSKSSNRFVALDSTDFLYLVDLDAGYIWKAIQCPMVEALSFCHTSVTDVLLAKTSGNIEKISLEPLVSVGHFTQHFFPVKEMLFLNDKFCLSYSDKEAWIWNIYTFEPVHSLTFKRAASLMKVVPSGGVLAVLEDGVFHVWRQPFKGDVPRLVASYVGRQFMVDGEVTCAEFAERRPILALAGCHKLISIVNVAEEYWTLESVMKLPQTANAVREMKFLTLPVLGEKNDSSEDKLCCCLAVFTLPLYELVIYNVEEQYLDTEGRPVCKLIDVENSPRGFQLTGGGYAVFRLLDGFVDVYSTFWWLTEKICPWLHYDRKLGAAEVSIRSSMALVAQPLRLPPDDAITQRTMYREVLHQLGELPPAERCDYWTLGLVLPTNSKAFRKLAHRGLHPVCQRLALPLFSEESRFLLTRLYSAFCYLSRLFYVVEDFPAVLVNFCKISSWNLMTSFEMVLTIMANYCSDWYSHYPNPPEHVVVLLDKVIDLKDKPLAEHLRACEVLPSQVGWALLSNLFVKALDLKRWAALWDHIIFCERDYLLMIAASIILNSRCLFSGFSKITDFDALQKKIYSSNINIGSVILVAHDLLDLQKKCQKTSYYDSFIPLEKEEFYDCKRISFDEKVINDTIHKKLKKLLLEDICLREKIDAFKLLDPRRPFNNVIQNIHKVKASLKVKESAGLYSDVKGSLQVDEEERQLDCDLALVEKERESNFYHLKKLLKDRELHWIPNRKFRNGENSRLEVFKSFWPPGDTVDMDCWKKKVEFQKNKPDDELVHNLSTEQSIDPRSSTVRHSENKRVEPEPAAVPESPPIKPINVTQKSKGKALHLVVPTAGSELQTTVSDESKKNLHAVISEYMDPVGYSVKSLKSSPYAHWEDEWFWLRYSLGELEEDMAEFGTRLKNIRRDLKHKKAQEIMEKWGEENPWKFPVPAEVPVASPGVDWRKDKREEFLALIDILYEKVNIKMKSH